MIKTFYTREGMTLLHSPSILHGVLLHTLLEANTKYHSTQNECAEGLLGKWFLVTNRMTTQTATRSRV